MEAEPGMQLVNSFHDEFWVSPADADACDAVRRDPAPERPCRP